MITDKQIRELALAISEARWMIEIEDIETAQTLLDHAASMIPDQFWPVVKENED